MKKKLILIFALMSLMIFCSCVQKNAAQQGLRAAHQYNPETDFNAEPIDGGRGVRITEYIGTNWNVNIPQRIQNIPVTEIGVEAFARKSIISVIIPNTVTSIGFRAFQNCSGLTSITIPNSVTSIGERVFQYCSGLTSITISANVTSISNHAFRDCTGLTNITIPNSVTSIDSEAFSNCSVLTSITIPNSVTYIGHGAFMYCSGLTSVIFQGTINASDFSADEPFPGDLRAKYLAGGIGTYTRPSGSNTWTKK